LIAAPGIKDITKTFSKKIIAHDCKKDGESRIERKPPGYFDIVLCLGQYVAPTGCWRLNSDPKKA